jgi:hypothetical protein
VMNPESAAEPGRAILRRGDDALLPLKIVVSESVLPLRRRTANVR